MSEHIYRRGDRVVWYESRTWGGKQANSAEFIEYRGDKSARIKMDNGKECTVRLVWVRPAEGND